MSTEAEALLDLRRRQRDEAERQCRVLEDEVLGLRRLRDSVQRKTLDKLLHYRNFDIRYDPVAYSVDSPLVWQFSHESYDGPEDPRIGNERSIVACMHTIDERFYDEESDWKPEVNS